MNEKAAEVPDGFCTCGLDRGDPREALTCGIARHRDAARARRAASSDDG